MVFLGLGVFIISVTFLAYRYPSLRWRQKQGYAPFDDEVADPQVKIGDDDRHSEGATSPALSTNSKDEFESPSTKPKAKAQHGALRDPIPTFNLKNGAAKEEASPPPPEQPSTPPPSKPQAQPSAPPSITPKISMPPPPRPSQPKSTSLMPPPSVRPSSLKPLPRTQGSLNPPPSAAATQRGPPRLSPATSSLSPNTKLSPASISTLPPSSRPSKKVLLPPGHSPLDWAHLTRNPPFSEFLRGKDIPPQLIKVSPSMLKERSGRKGRDAWGTWQGRVYNMTPYRDFHPGGVGELMRGAGKVGIAEKLFNEIHPWVNWEGMLGECLVGILVSEEEAQALESQMDEMD
ncbi:MAG: hypothetical protein MMC23_000931 [Stictis urceolatum]|nr:hypothetical protein [Stictis urceolata]